jgi:hypothetical protein
VQAHARRPAQRVWTVGTPQSCLDALVDEASRVVWLPKRLLKYRRPWVRREERARSLPGDEQDSP